MAELRDVLIYFCKHYPHPQELSNARLTKMVYLADWRSALLRGRQMTTIRWEFSHYGPFVHEISRVAKSDPAFDVRQVNSMFGNTKEEIRIKPDVPDPDLPDDEREILDHVIATTGRLYWDGFMKLVYSTYPVVTQPRYSLLDLEALAAEYQDEREEPAIRR